MVEPDLVFVAENQAQIIGERNVTGVPALLIEVLSKTRMDRVHKCDLYARFGVSEYWIVDGDADRVEVYRHDHGRFGKPEILEPGDVLETSLLPGLSIDLAGLFAR